MNLYELTGKYRWLMDAMEENNEEEIEKLLKETSDSIEEKAEGYAMIIQNLDSEINAYKREENRLAARREAAEKNVKRLKNNLKESMLLTGKTKFRRGVFDFSVVNNGGVLPFKLTANVEDLPDEFKKVEYTADVDAIKKYVEATGDLEYGYFEERGKRLSIR